MGKTYLPTYFCHVKKVDMWVHLWFAKLFNKLKCMLWKVTAFFLFLIVVWWFLMQFFEGLSPKIWHSISIHRVHIKQFSIYKQVENLNSSKVIFFKFVHIKVHIFWEGHKILRNLHLAFVVCSASQK